MHSKHKMAHFQCYWRIKL